MVADELHLKELLSRKLRVVGHRKPKVGIRLHHLLLVLGGRDIFPLPLMGCAYFFALAFLDKGLGRVSLFLL